MKPTENFLKKCYPPDDFDLFSLVVLSIATSRSNLIGPKKIQSIIVQVTRSFLQQLGECWKQGISKKKVTFPVKKKHFYIFFSSYRVLQTSITISSSSTLYSSKFGASKMVSPQRPDKLLKTECFQKERQNGKHSNGKKLAFFFLYYRVWQISKNIVWGCTRSFDIYCTINKI